MKNKQENMSYSIDTVRSIMKYFFMIDEKDILPPPNIEKGEQCSCVDKILWDSMWQCENYTIKRGFFGAEPTKGSWKTQDLVTHQESTFEFVSRKIILDNIVYEIYSDLVRNYDKDYVQKGVKYMTWGRKYGYHELKRRNLLDSDFTQNIPDTVRASINNLEQKTRDRIRSCKETNYYKKIISDLPDDQGRVYLLSGKKKKLPAFDAQFLGELITGRVCEYMDSLQKMENRDKVSIVDKLNDEIQSMHIGKREFVINENRRNGSYERERVLDNNCYLYTMERVFRVNMIDSINEVLKILQDFGIRQGSLESALLKFITSSLAFGGEYLIKYPLKYIYNNNFLWNNKEEGQTRNQDRAENIWIDRYIKYLKWIICVELPIVRNTVFCNLWSDAKSRVNREQENCSNNDIIKRMIDLLRMYLEEHLGCVAADYSVFLDWQGEPLSNLCYEKEYPYYMKDLYASMIWKNNKKYATTIKDKPLGRLHYSHIAATKWQKILGEIYQGGTKSPFEMELYSDDAIFGQINAGSKEWGRKIAELRKEQFIV